MLRLAYYKGRKSENNRSRFLDHIICFFTNSRYSHVELVYMYDADTKIGSAVSASPRDGGVRFKRIIFKPEQWELYGIETDKTDLDVIDWFKTIEGSKYDWFGALGVILPFNLQKKSRWFCSEAVATFFGIPTPKKKSPQDIFDYYASDHIRIV